MRKDRIRIHERIHRRHPELSATDVLNAWNNAFVVAERVDANLPRPTLVALGHDGRGRVLELIGAVLEDGVILVFHAQTPPTKKVLNELWEAHRGVHNARRRRPHRSGHRRNR